MDHREEEEEDVYPSEEEGEDIYPMDGADLGACWCHDSAVCPDEIEDSNEVWEYWLIEDRGW